jgi:hypothetical protein
MSMLFPMTEIDRLLSERQTCALILEQVSLDGYRFIDVDENGHLDRDVTDLRADQYSRYVVRIDRRLNELRISATSPLVAA